MYKFTDCDTRHGCDDPHCKECTARRERRRIESDTRLAQTWGRARRWSDAQDATPQESGAVSRTPARPFKPRLRLHVSIVSPILGNAWRVSCMVDGKRMTTKWHGSTAAALDAMRRRDWATDSRSVTYPWWNR